MKNFLSFFQLLFTLIMYFRELAVALHKAITISSFHTFTTMTPVVLLFAVSLLQSCEGTISGTSVFAQTRKDLLLHVKERFALKKGDDFRWKFNGRTNIVKLDANNEPFIYDDYKGRVEFSVQNYTLCLKSVRKADSGRYTAVVSGNEDEVKAEYKVTVLDPVSPVKLTVSNSSDSCNLTVTCSTQDSHISHTFLCHNKTCSEEGGERLEGTPYPSSMNVYLKQGVIICNHSNQVSWEHAELKIKHHCEQPPASNGAVRTWIGIGAAGLVIVLGTAFCSVFFCRYYKKKSNGNTIYEVPQDVPKTESLYQDPTDEVSGLSPTSTYCLVQFQTRPEQPPRNTPQPETVYAQVNRAAKTKCRSPQNKHPELNNMDDNDVQD